MNVNIEIPDDTHQGIKIKAIKEGMSLRDYIVKVLKTSLQK